MVPDPAKRKIERYTPSARKMGGQIKNDAINILRIEAFQSCQSPKRREKANQITEAQITESTKNAMIFLARRSRFVTADSAAMNFWDIFLEFGMRLSGIFLFTVRLHDVPISASGAVVLLSQYLFLFNGLVTTSKLKT